MCVVIVAKKGQRIPYSHLRTANGNNPHGWGLAVRTKSGFIHVERGFSSNALVTAYRRHADGDGVLLKDMVVHCRIGTSGKNDLTNTHPFEITPNLWMFHNGIFRDIKLTEKGRSDTYHLAQLLKPAFEANPELLEDEKFLDYITKYCRSGYSNKLVFFSATETVIINKEAGVWYNGVWYSNRTAFPQPTAKFKRATRPLSLPLRHTLPASPRPQRDMFEEDEELYVSDSETLVRDPDWEREKRIASNQNQRWEAYVERTYGKKATRVG